MFKQYLLEARLAPLYHGTDVRALPKILESKLILPNTYHENKKLLMISKSGAEEYHKGISLTRSLKFAKTWKGSKTIVFELNQLALTQKFRIKPIQWYDTKSSRDIGKSAFEEFEEFVITDKGIPFTDKYIVRMYLNRESENYFKNELRNHLNFIVHDQGGFEDDYDKQYEKGLISDIEMIENLKKNKKVVLY